ncbi:molybdopterin molybdotransferase MoeA [Sulfurimonas sp.]|uniref:molybdopterin molybdotransferase MoeA n=1 Tax=Sulfurimonas sp. TaxID=2022749 RepID=UPI0025EA8E29|nr:molybdopterin molybdotransferase MoeA [Sulfurimonas sp.]
MAVTAEQALEYIYANTKVKSIYILPIENVLGFVLAEDIKATHNLPSFDNSAMDGYAVKTEDAGKTVEVIHTIFAGDNPTITLQNNQAIKIMTGAMVPKDSNCIVPIEDVIQIDKNIKLPQNLKQGRHIRLCGEDIKKETTILQSGQRIFAHHITLLTSQGISHVKVYKKPKVAIFASGDELKMHFQKVESYQLYNTNSPTFFARAEELGCEVDFIGTASDTLEDIQRYIKSALDSDLIITSGGVSVGDADFTKEAFGKFGYEIFFDKVEIKPGKPTTFGRIKNTLVLNLPGNPLAATLNFELFAKSIILAMSGDKEKYIGVIETKISDDFYIKPGRVTITPGYFDGKIFAPLKDSSPGMITPMACSNTYMITDEKCEILEKDSIVKIIPTRFSFNSTQTIDLLNRR